LTVKAASAREEFIAGIRTELPILVGVIPFGVIYGVLALESGLTPAEGQAMSSIVFAGSAQFIATQMFAGGAPGFVIALTVIIVNLRHLLYSASLTPFVMHLRPKWRWLLAYLLTDEAYAVTVTHYAEEDRITESEQNHEGHLHSIGNWLGNRHWFFLGAGLALWTTWQLSTAVGITLGVVVPQGWSLDFAIALTFIALLLPFLKDRPSQAAALTAGVTAVLAYHMAFKFGLVLAAVIGILVGVWLESRQ
jgi:predicted branched-subunit amino acid permease